MKGTARPHPMMVAFRLLALFLALISRTCAFSPPIRRHVQPRTLPEGWTAYGCWTDSTSARTLASAHYTDAESMTIGSCINFCLANSFNYAGVERNECHCGNTLTAGARSMSLSECMTPCSGDSSQSCGATDRLNIYLSGGQSPRVRNTRSGTPYGVTTGLQGLWTYTACYVGNANGPIFGNEYDSSGMTVENCVSHCSAGNFALAAVKNGNQCFCSNSLADSAVTAPDGDCYIPCEGSSTETCGGPNRLSVYTSTGQFIPRAAPTIQSTGLPGPWTYKGCLAEPTNGQRVLPFEMNEGKNNTVDTCLTECATYGYPAAGLEDGVLCLCGDVNDITASGGTYVPDSECNIPCSGDSTHVCGAANRSATYFWTGPPMYVWNTPENTGHYEFLIGGLMVPLIATVGINDKVTFLAKWPDAKFPNTTGAYELDISLVDNYRLAWREMHVKSNVFCSGSIILPDKGARQINVGGWSAAATYGVRLYYPDGKPGVNGTHDWEENYDEVALQRARWYPAAMMMSNGSILVMGGETMSNGAPQPSLEILPKPPGGDTVITLDYLQRTDPNNLYPFLLILSSGRIFIGYWNEARILDPVTFDTLTILPNMPGSVNNTRAGRNYPMEGTAVLLPQYAPYTDPIEILICGGSSPSGGRALDNCISIAPEVESPTWSIERMPSKRVMPCMVTLPDGTYMIMNGAQQGFAGFAAASAPNLNALLYDPSKPVGQRISILGSTIVARLYHSEATLLPDGRVLVSGSDPETYYPNGSYVFPEEFRIEVYVPPYLTQGLKQPEFTITETDWALGGKYTIDVTLFQGTTGTMRVSLIAASSSTHGNVMSGGRILFPEFSCSGTSCTITAPPNACVCPPGWHQLFVLDGPTPSHSAWVRIGGDPAKIGNWPDFPDFTLPGV